MYCYNGIRYVQLTMPFCDYAKFENENVKSWTRIIKP